mgnify:CR=1 FL=1
MQGLHTVADLPPDRLPFKRRRPALWTARVGTILLGVVLAWLVVEIALRVFFLFLPPRLQLVLQTLHKTPFSDERLIPDRS